MLFGPLAEVVGLALVSQPMDADKTAALWNGYRSRKIDETIHPDDWIFAGCVNGMADYLVVGVCGARVVHAALTASPTEQARRPLANFAFGLAGPTQRRVGDHHSCEA